MDSSLLAQYSPADLAVFKIFGSTIVTKNEGSAIFRFATNVSAVKDNIQEGAITHMIEDIITHMDDSYVKELSQLKVTLRCLHNKKSNMSKQKKGGVNEVTSYLKVPTDVTLEWSDFCSLQIYDWVVNVPLQYIIGWCFQAMIYQYVIFLQAHTASLLPQRILQ